MVNRILRLAACLAAVLVVSSAASAAPPESNLLPVAKYTTDKARQLATKHAQALNDLNALIYHCVPWVEVRKETIGFFRPLHIQQDDRYLSIRIYIEQDPSPAFQALKVAERASAMFSRYAGPLLKRMAASAALVADPNLDGFTVILEWQKQGARGPGGNPVHETIAIFMDKALAAEYLAARIAINDLAQRAKVFGFDGETKLGELKVTGWVDNFVYTYKVKDYQIDPSVNCLAY